MSRVADLFHAEPLELFDDRTRTYRRFVTLRHDDPSFAFTFIVGR